MSVNGRTHSMQEEMTINPPVSNSSGKTCACRKKLTAAIPATMDLSRDLTIIPTIDIQETRTVVYRVTSGTPLPLRCKTSKRWWGPLGSTVILINLTLKPTIGIKSTGKKKIRNSTQIHWWVQILEVSRKIKLCVSRKRNNSEEDYCALCNGNGDQMVPSHKTRYTLTQRSRSSAPRSFASSMRE
jgi:hypothetical protein